MSLLMDALKKAEQEKKEAARRQRGKSDSMGEEKQASTNIDDTDPFGHAIVDGSTTEELPSVENTGLYSNTAELELEPLASADDTAEIPNISGIASSPEPEDPTLNVTINELSLAELSGDAIADDDADEQQQTSISELQADEADLLDETFHGVSLDDTALNPELFQETVQGDAFLPDDGARTWGETLPGVPAAQLAEDIGGDDQPTPVAAQTVFTATGTTRPSGAGFKWILGGLCTMALIASVVWYYFTITPMNRALPSPQIARGIEDMGPPLNETLDLNIIPPAEPLVAVDEAGESTASLAGTLAAEESPADTEEVTGADDTGEQLVAADPAVQTEADMPAESGAAIQSPVAGPPVSAGPPAQAAVVAGMLPESIEPEPSLIKISRSKSADDQGKVIQDAYFAYQKGAYGTAAEKYQQALKDFPDNRDALLGLASIAASSGDYGSAYNFYRRVLKLYPGDRFARAALINLQDREVLLNSESTITSMLHDNPDTHFLHFTLGNIYAAGSRWAEAQQAFFDAYRLNSGNPDYALNLAISLDHIGQYRAALDYYNAALELSNQTPFRFDSSPVKKRIDELTQVAER